MNRKLSPRETEVYNLIMKGHTNIQISDTLGISHQTTKNHVKSILRKKNMPDARSLLAGKSNGGKNRNYKTYLIRVKGTDFIKIGAASDVEKRRRSLQTGCPYELEIVKIIDKDVEMELQEKYHDYHVRGEWYELELGVMGDTLSL
jgi:DNA-binding CsgD family transcriptional regulator